MKYKNTKALSLLVTVLILVSAAYGSMESNSASSVSDHEYKQGTEERPIVVKGTITTNVVTPSRSAEQMTSEKLKADDDHQLAVSTVRLMWLTAVLAVIGVVQLFVFVWQYRLTARAVEDAGIAARAAKETAEIAPKIEKAYVFAKVQLGLTAERENNSHIFGFDVVFTNHGKTPAIIRRIRACPVFSNAPPTALINNDRAERLVPDGLVIGADKEFIESVELNIDESQWTEFVSASQCFYVVGLIDYEDIVDGQRSTGFCWQVHRERDGIKSTIFPSPLNYFS